MILWPRNRIGSHMFLIESLRCFFYRCVSAIICIDEGLLFPGKVIKNLAGVS